MNPPNPSETLSFTKAHGTENDFVLLPDPHNTIHFDSDVAARLADRRRGIGADGVIRVVPTEAAAEPEVRALAATARWFMDYRNSDGSLAQMCGNGSRVFAAYLRRQGWETETEFTIATRSGPKRIRLDGEMVATTIGRWRLAAPERIVSGADSVVQLPGIDPLPGLSVDMGNPHTVVALPESVELDAIDLTTAPVVSPVPDEGTNVELVRVLGPQHIEMRVHERGSGETRSCGTGVCAAVLATSVWSGTHEVTGVWVVETPGGQLRARPLPQGEVELIGPATFVAEGTVNIGALEEVTGPRS